VSLPQGFRYAAVYAGIRKIEKDDLALIVSDTPAVAAAVFTQNRVVAAPVVLARKNLAASRGKANAILVNAGNANCATRTGDQVALATIRATATALGVKTENILPASTGVSASKWTAAKSSMRFPHLWRGLMRHVSIQWRRPS